MTLRDIEVLLGLSTPKRVLIVEDHIPFLLRLAEYCMEAGHEVVGLAGVDVIDGRMALCRGIEHGAQKVVDLSTFDVAFLDHYFLSARYNGALLTKELLIHGSPRIFGMSSDASANAAMIRAGAVAALRKSELGRLLL